MSNMNNNIEQYQDIYPNLKQSYKSVNPYAPVPYGYKKVIHRYYTEWVSENEPVATTPYTSVCTTDDYSKHYKYMQE